MAAATVVVVDGQRGNLLALVDEEGSVKLLNSEQRTESALVKGTRTQISNGCPKTLDVLSMQNGRLTKMLYLMCRGLATISWYVSIVVQPSKVQLNLCR